MGIAEYLENPNKALKYYEEKTLSPL